MTELRVSSPINDRFPSAYVYLIPCCLGLLNSEMQNFKLIQNEGIESLETQA